MSDESEDVKIRAIISVPMVGWNPHWGCVSEALRPFGIPIQLGYGAYWHQTMSNLMEDAVNDGIDWVLTLDYDSMFSPQQLSRLMNTFGRHPEIDALAALQCKRGTEETPLLSMFGQTSVEVTGEPLKVSSAHFGLTLFRTESLKRTPMPWFVSQPDEKGSYKTLGRCDADIYFWKAFLDAGHNACVDPTVAIGHLQPMVACYDENMQPVHVHTTEYRKRMRA